MRSTLYIKYKSILAKVFLLGAAVCATSVVKAQLNPLASQYYQNQYLFNPAMAGINEGFNVNLAYSKEGMSVDGQQSMQAISVDYQAKKVGLGLSVVNDFSGLFRTTRAVVTYAYHVPVGPDNQKLSFGLSGGMVNQHLEISNVVGDQSDLTIARYNDKPNYVDGDFGAVYTSNTLTLQAALPNLRTLYKDNNTAEREVFFTSASYKFGEAENVSLEPKLAYRKVKGFDNIIDGGVNVAFDNNAFSVQGMYHSSNSATFGVGLNKTSFSILAFYTTNTSALNAYNNGDFELSLRFNFLGKK